MCVCGGIKHESMHGKTKYLDLIYNPTEYCKVMKKQMKAIQGFAFKTCSREITQIEFKGQHLLHHFNMTINPTKLLHFTNSIKGDNSNKK